MAERVTKRKDGFEGYRKTDLWPQIKPLIESEFPNGKIPENIEPHLMEWVGIRQRLKGGMLTREEFDDLRVRFGDEHGMLFENSLFRLSVMKISTRFEKIG